MAATWSGTGTDMAYAATRRRSTWPCARRWVGPTHSLCTVRRPYRGRGCLGPGTIGLRARRYPVLAEAL
eukprot:3683656-Rhodomonas_salina.6